MIFQSVRGSRSGYTAVRTLENLRESLRPLYIDASIVALYDAPDDEEIDKEVKPQVVKLDEALDALERLKLYKGQQEDSNKTLITALIKAERVIRGR